MDSSAGRRTWSRSTSSWGARVVHRQRDQARPSARPLGFLLLAITLSAGPSGCLLDPLKIGPGDELSDEADDLVDESDASSTGPSDTDDKEPSDTDDYEPSDTETNEPSDTDKAEITTEDDRSDLPDTDTDIGVIDAPDDDIDLPDQSEVDDSGAQPNDSSDSSPVDASEPD